MKTFLGILIPFLGTTLGASCVFFMKRSLGDLVQRALAGFAAGVMVLDVTLHNIPEGMAVGVVYAGFLSGNTQITAASALALSLGIAIQNFPEGAIISMPLRAEGGTQGPSASRRRTFRRCRAYRRVSDADEAARGARFL